jgi:hypothetical protein
MSKGNISLTLPIKGRDWQFVLLPDKTFDKLHNADGGGRAGVTMPNQYIVHFRKSDWCMVDIRHELGHVLKHMTHTGSVELSVDDMEELMCEIMASNYNEIGLWADRIAERFFNRD